MTTYTSIVEWQTVQAISNGWPVIAQMYPSLEKSVYLERIALALKYDYRQYAYIDMERTCRGVVGLWFFPRVWCGLQGDIDNLVVDQSVRSQGIGKQLLDHCLQVSETRKASMVSLDTFVENPASHRFYFREGFSIRGYHFVKALGQFQLWGVPSTD